MTKAARSHLRSVPTGQTSEDALISRAAEGDREAFSELFRTHARYIAGVAFRILGSNDEVDDVVQDTFIAAHRGLAQLQETRAFRRWLVTIAIRQVNKRLGKKKRAPFVRLELLACEEPATDPEQERLAEDLYEALSGISADLRIPWVLSRVEGRKLEDVASACDISLATAKRRISLAGERLRRRLDNG